MVCIDDGVQTKIWLLECLLVDDNRRTMAAAAGNYKVVNGDHHTTPLGLARKNCCCAELKQALTELERNTSALPFFSERRAGAARFFKLRARARAEALQAEIALSVSINQFSH